MCASPPMCIACAYVVQAYFDAFKHLFEHYICICICTCTCIMHIHIHVRMHMHIHMQVYFDAFKRLFELVNVTDMTGHKVHA